MKKPIAVGVVGCGYWGPESYPKPQNASKLQSEGNVRCERGAPEAPQGAVS